MDGKKKLIAEKKSGRKGEKIKTSRRSEILVGQTGKFEKGKLKAGATHTEKKKKDFSRSKKTQGKTAGAQRRMPKVEYIGGKKRKRRVDHLLKVKKEDKKWGRVGATGWWGRGAKGYGCPTKKSHKGTLRVIGDQRK